MKVLVLGTGAREHAIAWKLSQSKSCESVFLHPGNAGTLQDGFSNFGETKGLDAISQRCRREGIGLIVIGPEQLLVEGYADRLRKDGFLVVGPNQRSARLESSKIFAKNFMVRAGVPTATFRIAESPEALSKENQFPVVCKLDGLAAGKGVVVVTQPKDISDFTGRVWHDKEFGDGPQNVLIEEFIPGRELSYLGLCDGENFVSLSSATDFKRVGTGNTGPNTGGMGVLSPSPILTAALQKKIDDKIVRPILNQMKREPLDYRGILYIGLMVTAQGDPFVLEFNARFGDPETQAILLRLQSDLLEMMVHTARGTLTQLSPLQWSPETALYVVGAAEGYPGRTATGDRIEGFKNVGNGARVFFAGVGENAGNLVTQGGRVLGVGALGSTVDAARKRAYENLRKIHWRGMHYRSDIGIIGEMTAQ